MPSDFNSLTRFMCMRYNDDHLFLAVDRPYPERTEGYAMLAETAVHVAELDEGSQVFVYDRGEFDYGMGESDQEDFSNFVWDAERELGNVAVDLSVLPTYERTPPSDFLPV